MPEALRQLPVDLNDVCIALDTTPGEMHWYLDAHTGATILVTEEYDPADIDGPSLDEIEAEPKRYLAIPEADPKRALKDMTDFIGSLEDPRLKESLELSLVAQSPYRRFKTVLGHVPEQRDRWLHFKTERLQARARQWLAKQGIEPLTAVRQGRSR